MAKEVDARTASVLHSAYVPNHVSPGQEPGGPSLTRQEFADEVDINDIMARYERTGGNLPLPDREPVYLDLVGLPDYQQSLEALRDAETAFMSLPAGVRREFDNDAGKFVNFATKKDNLAKLREWGLAAPEPVEPAPAKVELVNPPASFIETPTKPPKGG